TVTVTVARGKRQKLTIQPLQHQPQTDWQALITGANGDQDALRDLWQQATQQQAPQQIFDAIQAAATPQQKGEQQWPRANYVAAIIRLMSSTSTGCCITLSQCVTGC